MKPLPLTPYRVIPAPEDNGAVFASRLIIFVGLCAILYFGRDIFIPIVLAILLAVLLAPAVRGLQRLRVPRAIGVLVAVTLTVVLLAGTAFLVVRTMTNLAANLPSYEANLREKARSLKFATAGGGTIEKAAEMLKDLQKEMEQPAASTPNSRPEAVPIPVEIRDTTYGPLQPIVNMAGVVAHPLVQLSIVILMLIFILFNREDLRNRLIRLAGTDDIHRTTLALDEAGSRLSRLFLGQFVINLSTGVFIGGALFLLGIPGALLWGLLTVVLRFIPFIGTIMGSVFPIIIALAVGDGWILPLAVAATVLGAELIAGQVLEPIFLGRMTGVSSTAIIVAAAFWTMLWGPVGLILATPITVGMLVVGRHIEALKFLDIMLGTETVLSPDHAFYQRMLAGDLVEAVDSAADFNTAAELQTYLETVAVPALYMAQADLARGSLTKDKASEVATTFSDALEDIWTDAGVAAVETDDPPIIIVAQHGVLNFAAAIAFSALLRLKGIPHRMLPQDAVSPDRFPDIDPSGLKYLCIISLREPSQGQMKYVSRRIASHAGTARLLNVAWSATAERSDVVNAHSAIGLLALAAVRTDEMAAA